MCDPPCENGACVANDTCNCADGFEGDQCTEPGTQSETEEIELVDGAIVHCLQYSLIVTSIPVRMGALVPCMLDLTSVTALLDLMVPSARFP